jgi:predicted phosphoribosyltransferase
MRELLSSKQEVVHMYKTFVIGYNPKAHKMAEEIEKKANELARDGYRVLSFSITNSGKAIILADDGKDSTSPEEK